MNFLQYVIEDHHLNAKFDSLVLAPLKQNDDLMLVLSLSLLRLFPSIIKLVGIAAFEDLCKTLLIIFNIFFGLCYGFLKIDLVYAWYTKQFPT